MVDEFQSVAHRGSRRSKHTGSVVVGSLWMVGISIALFFLPVINGFVGGFVGGYKVGSAGRALIAAVLPALAVAFIVWGLFAVFEAPLWGILAGMTGALIIALAEVGLFVGAVLGGLARARTQPSAGPSP